MAFCFEIPEPSILYFLQESAKCLPKPAFDDNYLSIIANSHVLQSPANSVLSQFPPLPGDPVLSITDTLHNFSALPLGFPQTHGTCSALDALNLISLECTSLVNAQVVQRQHYSGNQIDKVSQTELTIEKETLTRSTCLNDCSVEAVDRKPTERRDENSNISLKKTPRKQKRPTRSAERHDPAFRGVMLQMKLERDNENFGNYKFLTTAHYSVKCRTKSCKLKTRELGLAQEVSRTSSSEEEGSPFVSGNKRCASCKTCKTPLWRDAEDGTPLCNACGIRYKKYGVRCFHCWNIPKKEGKAYSNCANCGRGLRSSMGQRKGGKRKCNSYLKVPGGTVCC
ncbi:GATA-type zinc finger protein 1 [Lissotriton helveticus]